MNTKKYKLIDARVLLINQDGGTDAYPVFATFELLKAKYGEDGICFEFEEVEHEYWVRVYEKIKGSM